MGSAYILETGDRREEAGKEMRGDKIYGYLATIAVVAAQYFWGWRGFLGATIVIAVSLLWEISDRLRTHTDQLGRLIHLLYMQLPQAKQTEWKEWLTSDGIYRK